MPYGVQARDVGANALRPGAVVGGIVAGAVGLIFIVGFIIYINRRINCKKTLQAQVRVDDPENSDALSISTYVDEKDSDTLYSPTERSPILHEDDDYLQNEKYIVEQRNATRPPPFPVYQDVAL
ncbi:hypothetical protein TWF696_007518 [Orbilia brochopaga]|uniref:Uncharacterized protein n=1 Tax=Orbilia brochopaga TaxID=3140254 RepID=A0AAV9UL72_9PEZI